MNFQLVFLPFAFFAHSELNRGILKIVKILLNYFLHYLSVSNPLCDNSRTDDFFCRISNKKKFFRDTEKVVQQETTNSQLQFNSHVLHTPICT